MSTKKPHLTIEIEYLGDYFNSKFKGYIDTPHSNTQGTPVSNMNVIYSYNVQGSYLGTNVHHVDSSPQHSLHSETSARKLLISRNNEKYIENRITNNLKTLRRSKDFGNDGNTNRSRENLRDFGRTGISSFSNNSARYKSHRSYRSSRKGSFIYNNSYLNNPLESRVDSYTHGRYFSHRKSFSRSKSSSVLGQSRAQILQYIAEKLGKVRNNYNDSFMQNSEVKSNRSNSSRVQKIKYLKTQMLRTRGPNKLYHLLKDVKKYNKYSYKIVYTIKKSIKNYSNKKYTQKYREKYKYKGKYKLKINKFTNDDNKELNCKYLNFYGKIVYGSDLYKLAYELKNVRLELKEVKNKNYYLLQLSRSNQSEMLKNTSESVSQSSRLTNRILEFDLASLDSNSHQNYQQYSQGQVGFIGQGSQVINPQGTYSQGNQTLYPQVNSTLGYSSNYQSFLQKYGQNGSGAVYGTLSNNYQGSIQGSGSIQGPVQGPVQGSGSIQGPVQGSIQGTFQGSSLNPFQISSSNTFQGPIQGIEGRQMFLKTNKGQGVRTACFACGCCCGGVGVKTG